MAQSAISDASEGKDIPWTDAQIRWTEDELRGTGDRTTLNDNSDDDSNDGNAFDLFADPDPHEIFQFRFVRQKKYVPEEPEQGISTENNDEDDNESIRLEIHGYKTGSDQVWESTGLTLWKASKYLCDYMVQHASELQDQRVLELGAGLGLNGILAHRLSADSVVITDGDSDAMIELRKNIAVNRIKSSKHHSNGASIHAQNSVSAAQLIWGVESSKIFLESMSSQFSIIIASDVIYAAIVIDPLWETIQTLLRKPDGEFWMAFAVRKVPVTIEFVLQKAKEYGFRYKLVDKQNDQDKSQDDGVEGNSETGPVFIYVFQWDMDKGADELEVSR